MYCIFSTQHDSSYSTFKQRITIHMCIHTCGCLMMATESNKPTSHWAHFFTTRFLLVSNPIHQYNMFLLASFFRQVKDTNKTTHPEACFFYNTFLYQLTNLAVTTTFLKWQVLKILMCLLEWYHFFSIDYWLWELIH